MARNLTAAGRKPTLVVYRNGGQRAREVFRNLSDALTRAEFIHRVEGCSVYIKHGWKGRPVLAICNGERSSQICESPSGICSRVGFWRFTGACKSRLRSGLAVGASDGAAAFCGALRAFAQFRVRPEPLDAWCIAPTRTGPERKSPSPTQESTFMAKVQILGSVAQTIANEVDRANRRIKRSSKRSGSSSRWPPGCRTNWRSGSGRTTWTTR